MLQKDAKLIFISSVNSSDKATCFLDNLKNASEKMVNVVNYVCPEHEDDFSLQDTLLACPCYKLYIPIYISIDNNIKSTTNLFMDDVFNTELMGTLSTTTTYTNSKALISQHGYNQLDLFRLSTAEQDTSIKINQTLFVYIDPAYTSNHEASGTGIAAVVACHDNPNHVIILGLEHFFLKDLTGTSTHQIASCAALMIKAISVQHPSINKVCVAVEGNSSQDSGVAIATLLSEYCSLPTAFCHYSDKSQTVQLPIYILGQEKSIAFEKFICSVNSGLISASQTIVSHTIKLSFDPIVYLIDQMKAIKVTNTKDGRLLYNVNKTSADDTLIATIMAHYMTITDKFVFKFLK